MAHDTADPERLCDRLEEALGMPPHLFELWLEEQPEDYRTILPRLLEILARRRAAAAEAFEARERRRQEEAAAQPREGDRVGPHVLVRELGRGVNAAVWLARPAHGRPGEPVALKLPRRTWHAGLAACIADGQDAIARLAHPDIARFLDAGVDEQGRPWLAQAYVDGEPIDAWCQARALPLRERVALVMRIARAVGHAHRHRILHRDLKPSNLLVTPDGAPRVLDFGLTALLERAGCDDPPTMPARLRTTPWASPEQVGRHPVTTASDIHSLGVVLHCLLAGGPPSVRMQDGDTAPASSRVADAATARAPRGDLDAILRKAMRRDPARRHATMDEFAQDLDDHLNGRPVRARPLSALRGALHAARHAFAR